MKLRVKKEDVIEGLIKAAAVIPPKAGAAYLRSIWLRAENGALEIMATDANIEFTGKYAAEVEAPGLVGVLGRSFVDLVRLLPNGEMSLELDEKGSALVLSQHRRSYRLPVNGPEWFENFSAFPEEEGVIWSGDFLAHILEQVTFCIADDSDAMEAIGCLFIRPRKDGKIDACGLNGHQFAMITFTHDQLCARLPESGVLIQKKYLADIKKWLGDEEIELNLTDKRVYLRRLDRDEILSVPRLGSEYPDYSVFLSKLDGQTDDLKAHRKEMIDALGRILVFNTDADRCVYFDLKPHGLELTAQGADTGSGREELEAVYKGELEKIAFPTRNLQEIFAHFVSGDIEMRMTGAEGPCGVYGSDDFDYIVIIMPMKVSESSYYTEE